jgi:hypothetical protein
MSDGMIGDGRTARRSGARPSPPGQEPAREFSAPAIRENSTPSDTRHQDSAIAPAGVAASELQFSIRDGRRECQLYVVSELMNGLDRVRLHARLIAHSRDAR